MLNFAASMSNSIVKMIAKVTSLTMKVMDSIENGTKSIVQKFNYL